MAKNRSYWKERFTKLEDSNYKQTAKYIQDVDKQFRMACNDIQIDINRWYSRLAENNGVSLQAAKKLLSKDELEEFHWTLEQYIEYGEKNSFSKEWMKELENASAKVHIDLLTTMKIQMEQQAEKLYCNYNNMTTDYLKNLYESKYYHTAYTLEQGLNTKARLKALDGKTIDKFITKPWGMDEKCFSDRIWDNKTKLVNSLHRELSQSIITGASPDKAIKNIAERMRVSRSQASRLVLTESTVIQAEATQQCLKDLGVEKYQVIATLDESTCPICQGMDGQIFKMSEYDPGMTAEPFHPNCRCTHIPYYEDDYEEGDSRAARYGDGKTEIINDTTYSQWKGKYVI